MIRACAFAAALALTAAAACAPRGGGAPHVAGPTAIPAAPSAPAWNASSLRTLRAQLRDALGASALPTSGIAIVDAEARPLFLRRERTAMTPASTFKVLVGATALETLGPNFRFSTTFESVDDPADGDVHGNVYLVGTGDPTLTRDDLRGGAGAVARAGVRTVSGAIVADGSAFTGPEVNRGWLADDLQYGYAAGTSALSLDQGTVEFHLVPASPGAPARIRVLPPSDAVRVHGAVITSYSTLLQIQRDPVRNDFTFGGRIAAGAEQSFWRPVVDLSLYAGQVARAMLRERGVVVEGGVRHGIAPLAPYVLWRHRSAPLRDVVHEMMLESNNHFAEQLLRAVGDTRGAGTEASGAVVERDLLRHAEVPQDGLRVVDGSGLAPSDRVAPLTLATLLARAAAAPGGAIFVRSLPRAGIEGTVRWRHLTDGLGRVRAKSGHIEDVNALTGYVDTRRHGRVAFAIIVNDRRADDGPVDAGIDRALDILARS
ncbi:MAG TPA: D-alanyl-D-alanine carboxypeptidase/D-alanyl-D-alanine-endopeptidase [Candidatus Elarobacter sp.]|jgi:D-alanyl-D-alanine carboxypeptidase/D-alanyl-D-alanine-endopeptidase (penicillin-binding protein 4)|nr:D-alanyl-D-alanine carboxypeptidase/D-alanyl-D-alanine-endopeptidase [Candidatus Elarobacter sp.]